MPRHREYQKHHDAFEIWYGEGRSFRNASLKVATPERTVRDWAEWFDWRERADARDAEAAAIAEREAIKRRAAMLLRHRQAGELMVRRGVEHFAKNPIEKTSDATSAIKAGVELERTSEGMPAWFLDLMNADIDALKAHIADLQAQLGVGAGDGAAAPGGEGSEGEGDSEDDSAALVPALPDPAAE